MQIYAPGTQIGQYRVLSKPMMGGMGVVYACHDLQNDRAVALKTFKPEYLPDLAARDRFLREGTAWVELGKHPHIVRCHNVLYIDPTAFLVLELVVKDEGREDASLRSWLGQPLPLETALLFALQIARGLQHATQKLPGFVHRDLKPENVLVGSDKLPGTEINRLRVTDFGLATMLTASDLLPTTNEETDKTSFLHRTHLTRGIMGTPLYMAPEQWTGEPMGVYTDVYALGCILYEMLTGEFVVSGRTIDELRIAHCDGKYKGISNGVPEQICNFLAKCLSTSIDNRFQSWEHFLKALESICVDSGSVLFLEQMVLDPNSEDLIQAASSHIEIGMSYLDMGKVHIALGYYEKALGIFTRLGDAKGESVALTNLGIAYQNLGDIERAIAHHNKSLKIIQNIKDYHGEASVLGSLGIAYARSGNLQKAIAYFEKCLDIHRMFGDRVGESADLANLGNVYSDWGKIHIAIEHYQEQLIIVRELGNQRGESGALGNLGISYAKLDDHYRAIEYFEQSLKLACEIGDRESEANALGNLGGAYNALGNFHKGIDCLRQSLKIIEETGDIISISMLTANLGTSMVKNGDIDDGFPLIKKAIEGFYQAGVPQLATQAKQFLSYYQQNGLTQIRNPLQDAFDAFLYANNIQEMQAVVEQNSIIRNDDFILAVQKVMQEQVSPDDLPFFEQRLAWLKQLTQPT